MGRGGVECEPCPDKRGLNPFPNDKFYTSKLPEFAEDNLKFDENGGKFSKRVENTMEKRRSCSSRAVSPFPTVFSKDLYCRHIKTRACLGLGKGKCIFMTH